MRHIFSFAAVCFLLAFFAGTAKAQDQLIDLSSKGARVFNRLGGQSLSLPSQAAPSAVVAEFLRVQGHFPDTVESLVLNSESTVARTDVTHLRFTQQVNGLTVYGTYVKAAVNGAGELIHLIENIATPPVAGVLGALIDERDALEAALAWVHPGVAVSLTEGPRSGNSVVFDSGPFFYQDPTVKRVAVAMQSGLLEEGFLVETWTDEENLLHHVLVGPNGRILNVELRTNNDSYFIFPDHPGNSNQTLTFGPGNGNVESPDGWLSGAQTTVDIAGNNVHAYLDRNGNNIPDGGGSPVTDGSFDAGFDAGASPTTPDNQAVAVQNLFYLNNVIHDKLYRHGFDEAAGNFQENNFGKGGAGSDSVNAEAQDGAGTNNANFSTPADGSNPRMQMFLWTVSDPNRDGDLDSDIPWHEYGHGLTWRMIGSMSGPMSGAIGEGMSDTLSILINDDDVVGEYSFNDPLGIRSAAYTNYHLLRTYGDFSGSSVHFDGEIFAAINWRLGEIFDSEGIARDTLFDYLVGGMNFTPAGPAFEDMRDGVLQQAAGSGHECLIWEGYAAYGVGVGAKARIRGGRFNSRITVTESFDLPVECSGPQPPGGEPPEVASCMPDSVSPNDRVTIQVIGSNFDSGATVAINDRISVQNVTFVNSSQLDVRVKVNRKANTGDRTVTVTNLDGSSHSLPGCLSVLGP